MVLAVAPVVEVLAVREAVAAAPDAVGLRAAPVLGLFAAAFTGSPDALRRPGEGTKMEPVADLTLAGRQEHASDLPV